MRSLESTLLKTRHDIKSTCPKIKRQKGEKSIRAPRWWLRCSITSSPKVPIEVVKKIAPSSKNSPPPDSLPQPRPKSSSPKPPPSLHSPPSLSQWATRAKSSTPPSCPPRSRPTSAAANANSTAPAISTSRAARCSRCCSTSARSRNPCSGIVPCSALRLSGCFASKYLFCFLVVGCAWLMVLGARIGRVRLWLRRRLGRERIFHQLSLRRRKRTRRRNLRSTITGHRAGMTLIALDESPALIM